MKNLILLLLSTFPLFVFSQINSASVLTDSAYFQNPKSYLSKLDTSKIQSDILIDRVIYDSLILNCNGKSRVTTINSTYWKNIYSNLKWGNIDTTYIPNIKILNEATKQYYKTKKIYPIGILDFYFKRIKQSALDNNEFIQESDYLFDNSANLGSFSSERIITTSCLMSNIYGDDVKFIVDDFFCFTNNMLQTLDTIEIDFDDGFGYVHVDINDTIDVHYGSESRYLEIKCKLKLKNNSNNETEILYTNSTVLKTGTSTVPLPSIISNQQTRSINPYEDNYKPRTRYYPESKIITKPCWSWSNGYFTKELCFYNTNPTASLEVNFLFNPNNKSNMLRKPFIVCDGFDPGDQRDYYLTNKEFSNTTKDNDFRGILQLINGDISPWYPNEDKNVNLIDALQRSGYDIVIVNFLNGADDIIKNGNAFKGFLDEIINTELRDDKTEESIIIGPSMGGLITRYAITSLEQDNKDVFVKDWFSFDSPQKGAYIPLGLQHTIDIMSNIFNGGIDQLEDAKKTFQESIDKINTIAAKEMLLQHYTMTNKTIIEAAKQTEYFGPLYSTLDNLGYPKFSKNYAITNGGKNKLYSENSSRIVSFKIFNWTFSNAWGNGEGTSRIIKAQRLGYKCDLQTSNQIPYENAPGGWHTGLYSLNCNPDNLNYKEDSEVKFTKSCFIPTVSSFGIKPTQSNIHNNWERYTGKMQKEENKIITPFDFIYGQEKNEEHVRISKSTRDTLLSILEENMKNQTKPICRIGDTLNQTITGKVAFIVENNLTFGGHGNTLRVMTHKANVNANAGKEIVLLPGFSIENGGEFIAKIDNTIEYGTTLRKASIGSERRSIDYSKPSPYLGQAKDYTNNSNEKTAINRNNLFFSISPNPVKNIIEIKNNNNIENYQIQIFDITGNIIRTDNIVNSNKTLLDLSYLNRGSYLVQIQYDKGVKSFKFIKQ